MMSSYIPIRVSGDAVSPVKIGDSDSGVLMTVLLSKNLSYGTLSDGIGAGSKPLFDIKNANGRTLTNLYMGFQNGLYLTKDTGFTNRVDSVTISIYDPSDNTY